MSHRPTRDADLVAFGPSDLDSIGQTFCDIIAVTVDEGIVFDRTSISVQEIRKAAGYVEARVIVSAELTGAHCKAQIDVGFGDEVTPAIDFFLIFNILGH